MPRFEDLEDAGLRVVIGDNDQVLRTVNAKGSNVGIGDGTLWQSGMPFVLPAGDGGSNGLTFTGTRGLFTLSSAILTGVYNMLSGCYMYLPAGAGGLSSAGWYWATFSSDTAGEVFANTYTPGTGTPPRIASPTVHPNLTSGRITQTTNEVTLVSFIMPGGSLGPNGIIRGCLKQVGNSSAISKSFKVKAGSNPLNTNFATTTQNNVDYEFLRQNAGIETRQIGNRNAGGWFGITQTTYSSDHSSIDTTVDQTVVFTMQLGANTDSAIMVPRKFQVTFGA